VKFDPSLHLVLSVQKYTLFSNRQNFFYDTHLKKVAEKQRKTILFSVLKAKKKEAIFASFSPAPPEGLEPSTP
jgi:hypothetical protein